MHSKPHRQPLDETSVEGGSALDGWRAPPAGFSRQQLIDALVDGGIAGDACSHDRQNVRWKIGRLVEGDPDLQFGLSGLDGFTEEEVLAMMAEEAGFDPDPSLRLGPICIDPHLVLEGCERAGERLAEAAARGERVILATGHPAGLLLLYMATSRLLEDAGAKLLRPAQDVEWRENGRHRQVRYFQGVAALTDRGSTIHTHGAGPMERMLEEARPDLVFADHGFAGAAIEAGIDAISIADVNDPAPVVARRQGRTGLVIVMDDNVLPESYWPCYQAIASKFD